MMSDENKKDEPRVQADNNSIAVGNISVGGNIGDIHIGNITNVYHTSEDDVPLSSAEIENGLTRFAEYLPERAPVMADKFNATARKLRATLVENMNALSPALKTQREDSVNVINLMCFEALDISFRALCQGANLPLYDSRPPFLGLFAFHPEDREFFFGREALIQKLVKRIKAHPFLAVLGASGSGKSSLVMAGLIPALDADMAYFTPSSAPLYQLHEAQGKAPANAVYVVDQFEELFTLTRATADREEFIGKLLALSKTNRVVITMRADFWGEVAIYKNLKQEMQDHQELIAPMDADELRDAMEKQAATVGLRFDKALGETILEEVRGEPGAMPLLQHALWMLWKRRHGLWLKAEEYQAFGGIRRAIATTADEFYESFSPEDRERMRNVFVRLTNLDGSGKVALDTRRRVRIKDLVYKNDTIAQTVDFIRGLANSRLLITSSETLQDEEVEVAHEALIRNWPRLRGWLDEDRLSLLVQEQIRDAASVWDASDNDRDAIAHFGGKLEDALHLTRNPRTVLNTLEINYLEACKKRDNRFWKSIRNTLSRWLLPILMVVVGLFVIVPFYYFGGVSVISMLALGIGTIIPLLTAFMIYRQDRYRIVETRWVIVCMLGGVFVYLIAARVNPALMDHGIFSRNVIIRVVAPIMETTLNGLFLYLILSRLKFSRTVDGIIYGVAVGAGFAAIENYEYILGYSDLALTIAFARVFSTNFVHMGVLGLSGFLLITAGFDKNRSIRGVKIFAALTLPSVINMAFNTMVNAGTLLVIAIAFGLSLILILGTIIRRLIRQEERWISKFLQGETAVQGSSPLNNVEQIAKTIRELFGVVRASQLERFLILQARRGILQKILTGMDDPKLRLPIEDQITSVQKKIRGSRGALGTYCWENIKTLIPEINKVMEN